MGELQVEGRKDEMECASYVLHHKRRSSQEREECTPYVAPRAYAEDRYVRRSKPRQPSYERRQEERSQCSPSLSLVKKSLPTLNYHPVKPGQGPGLMDVKLLLPNLGSHWLGVYTSDTVRSLKGQVAELMGKGYDYEDLCLVLRGRVLSDDAATVEVNLY